jgi:hypothetical protein
MGSELHAKKFRRVRAGWVVSKNLGLHFINRKTGKLYLMNSKLFDCQPGNRCRVFDAGLRDFEHPLGNYPRYGVVTLFETKSTQCLLIGGD